jgi:hypothetical protein
VLIFGAPDSVRCAPDSALGPYIREQATLGNSAGALHYNSLDYPVCTGLSGEPAEQRLPAHQRLFRQMNSDEQCRDRSQSAEVTEHRTVRCSKTTRRSNGQLLQTLMDALTWRAPDNEQWVSGAPIASSLSQRLGSG